MTRYHPAIVTLHWLLAFMVIVLLLWGGELSLTLHIVGGLLIGGLFTLRLGIKYHVKPPRPVSHNPMKNRLAATGHRLIYALVFAVVVSGLGIMIKADLLQVIQTQQPLPAGFSELAILKLHLFFQIMLLVVICGHIVAALYHQFVLTDGLFARMKLSWKSRKPKQHSARHPPNRFN